MNLLTEAIQNNVEWCALVSGGETGKTSNGVWLTPGTPHPLFPDAVTLRPGVSAEYLAQLLAGRAECAAKDSFADVDMRPFGFRELFAASWIGRERAEATDDQQRSDWTPVTDKAGLESWCAAAGLPEPLPLRLLDDSRVRVLAARDSSGFAAGAVVNLTGLVAGLSNVFGADPQSVWAHLPRALDHHGLRMPMVGYEGGAELQAAVAAGFADLGPLRVWIRP